MALDFVSAIDDVKPVSVDRETDRLGSAGADGLIIHELEGTVGFDGEHRNGVASLVDREEETPVGTGDDFLVGIIRSEQSLGIGKPRAVGLERSKLRDLTVAIVAKCNHGVLARVGIVGFGVNETRGGFCRCGDRHELAGFQ